MKNDRSQKEIVRIYEHFKNTLTVISFGADGYRTMSYSGLSLFKAIKEKLAREKIGQQAFIVYSGFMRQADHDDINKVKTMSYAVTDHFSSLEEGKKASGSSSH